MSVPKQRKTASAVRRRGSHKNIKSQTLAECSCGAPKQSHRACPKCGKY